MGEPMTAEEIYKLKEVANAFSNARNGQGFPYPDVEDAHEVGRVLFKTIAELAAARASAPPADHLVEANDMVSDPAGREEIAEAFLIDRTVEAFVTREPSYDGDDREPGVDVILPSEVRLTFEEAGRFGRWLVWAALQRGTEGAGA